MIAQLERQESQAASPSLLQRDDCTTKKTRIIKQPALFVRGMIAQLERQESQATSPSLLQQDDCITRKTRKVK